MLRPLSIMFKTVINNTWCMLCFCYDIIDNVTFWVTNMLRLSLLMVIIFQKKNDVNILFYIFWYYGLDNAALSATNMLKLSLLKVQSTEVLIDDVLKKMMWIYRFIYFGAIGLLIWLIHASMIKVLSLILIWSDVYAYYGCAIILSSCQMDPVGSVLLIYWTKIMSHLLARPHRQIKV